MANKANQLSQGFEPQDYSVTFALIINLGQIPKKNLKLKLILL